ncbi:hypothetical protein EDB86DRAFT_3092203 [Lactarius hatsudake]|nr:hypothetical protein EDB86DRAFT_3092203 [Lactarius hatsudake]
MDVPHELFSCAGCVITLSTSRTLFDSFTDFSVNGVFVLASTSLARLASAHIGMTDCLVPYGHPACDGDSTSLQRHFLMTTVLFLLLRPGTYDGSTITSSLRRTAGQIATAGLGCNRGATSFFAPSEGGDIRSRVQGDPDNVKSCVFHILAVPARMLKRIVHMRVLDPLAGQGKVELYERNVTGPISTVSLAKPDPDFQKPLPVPGNYRWCEVAILLVPGRESYTVRASRSYVLAT